MTNIESVEISLWDGSIYLYPLDKKCKDFNAHVINEPLAQACGNMCCHLPCLTCWNVKKMKGRKEGSHT
jgi:hypothetical protein